MKDDNEDGESSWLPLLVLFGVPIVLQWWMNRSSKQTWFSGLEDRNVKNWE